MNPKDKENIVAKSFLVYGNTSPIILLDVSIREAYKMLKYTDSKTLYNKSIKIFRNSLKFFSKKELIKYCNINKEKPKKELINEIINSYRYRAMHMINFLEGVKHENSSIRR